MERSFLIFTEAKSFDTLLDIMLVFMEFYDSWLP